MQRTQCTQVYTLVGKTVPEYTLVEKEEVTSTNDVASSLLHEKAEHFTVVTANKQTAGRGRMGRQWETVPQTSLACSIILTKDVDDKIPLLIATSLCKALRKFAPAANIKWPNDILIEGGKVAGILVENPSSDEYSYIVGIGVNLQDNDALPAGSTSLEAHKHEDLVVEKSNVLLEILTEIFNTLGLYHTEGWPYISMQYQNLCGSFDRDITWKEKPDATGLKGKARALNSDGALLIQLENGTLKTITTGEIISQGKSL